ncbi:MAG: Gfo/Idh/MocA family oxidoreductase [Deltaproteobacteria bacterium]|nr:Gfo/Idh/MocA family oxidoreductase [Deltaproteobacteria bacterium]
MNKKGLKVLLIGLGHMGEFHLKKILSTPQVSKIVGVDSSKERLNIIKNTYPIETSENYETLLKTKPFDVAFIATPSVTHFKIAKACLSFGLDIFIEKPAVTNMSEAEELLRLSKKNDCLIQVGFLERFNPTFKKCYEFFKNPLFFEAHRLGTLKRRSLDIDVVHDLMVHDLDLILAINPYPVESVDALGVSIISHQVDLANARIHFSNSSIANLTASRVSMKEMRKMRLFQIGAYISLDFVEKSAQVVRLDKKEGFKLENIVSEGEPDALQSQTKAFFEAVQNRTQPQVTMYDAMRTMEVIDHINSSIANNLKKIKKANKLSNPNEVLFSGL